MKERKDIFRLVNSTFWLGGTNVVRFVSTLAALSLGLIGLAGNVVRCVSFGTKMGQIGLKWDKSWTFSDQISLHFGESQYNLI